MGVQDAISRGMAVLTQLEAATPSSMAGPMSLAAAQDVATTAMAGELSGLDDGLTDLYFATSGHAGTMAAYLGQSMTLGLAAAALSSDGRFVTVDVSVKAGGDASALLAQLQGLGLVNGSSYAGMASGELPVSALGQLSSLSLLGQAHASMMVLDAGSVESQGVKAERADLAQTAHPNITGAGVRLGILSTSFDTDTSAVTHMAGDIASGDLPADTVVVADSTITPTDEGRAMAQLAHDVAPGASIDFATASGGQAAFANNIIALAEQHGDKVIVDDVRYMQELSYQNGPIAQAIEQVVQKDGVTYFSSDTNDSTHGWEGAWANGSTFTANGMTYTSLAFAPGQDYLPITLTNAGETGTFSLQWDEPGASAGGPGATSDLDVYVYSDAAMTHQVGSMTANQIGGDPVAIFTLNSTTAGQTFYVRVAYNSTRGGGTPPEVRLVSVSDGAPMTFGSTASNINAGSVLGHKVGGDAIGVGEDTYAHTPAYDPADYPNGQLDAQSGVGFDKVTWSDAGTRLTTPVVSTPQIVGVDGVSTTFFPSTANPGPYVFNGTSAAAPDVAAVAVLMLQANTALTRNDVLALLQDSALDMDNPYTPGFDAGFDNATGAGLVQADLAVNFALGGVISNASQTTLHGTHLNDRITGSAANDTIYGGGGNDVIDGGAGVDTVVFSGAQAQYAIRYNADGTVTVTDGRPGAPDGAETLRNVERLSFSDGVVAVSAPIPTPPPTPTPMPSSSAVIQADNLIRVVATDPALSDPTSPIYALAHSAAALAAQSAAGQLNPLDAQSALYHLVDGTTSVAEIAYAFFTGKTPTAAGLDYLVHSAANATDLNDAYYQQFTVENRYINFANNLATGAGAGAAAFQAAYGSLSLSDAVTQAYTAVFGFAPAAGKVDAILGAQVSNGLGGTETRAQYFADITGGSTLSQKAAAVGFLLADSVKEGFGAYQQADLHFLADLAHGTAVFNVDLLVAYTQAPALVGQPVADPTLGS